MVQNSSSLLLLLLSCFIVGCSLFGLDYVDVFYVGCYVYLLLLFNFSC